MVLGKASLSIVLVVLLTFPAAGPVGAVPPPPKVMAFLASDAAVIYWVPADPTLGEVSYKVYGEQAGQLIHLATTRLNAHLVLGEFDRFAVTTVYGDDESDPTYAVGGICIKPGEMPPVHHDCPTSGLRG